VRRTTERAASRRVWMPGRPLPQPVPCFATEGRTPGIDPPRVDVTPYVIAPAALLGSLLNTAAGTRSRGESIADTKGQPADESALASSASAKPATSSRSTRSAATAADFTPFHQSHAVALTGIPRP